MIRNDFVSNSSSSSFVIGFKDKKTMEKFRDTLKEEWGGKMAKLLDKFFSKEKENLDPKLYGDFAKRFKLFYYGIYESTEDSYDYIAAGALVFNQCPCNDDIDIFTRY